MDHSKRGSFKGGIGFVLAAAGSAVGLGNIWRFPYLAARDGGGLFLVIYLVLAVTFGFALLTTEVSIGRKTRQSPLTAYGEVRPKWKWIGVIAYIVPFLIMPYYCVIGGWVIKYFIVFLTGHGLDAAADTFFTGFITSEGEPVLYTFIFLAVCAVVIYIGVRGGIEASSRIIMPVLVVLVIGIAIFSLTVSGTNSEGKVVTGLDGLKIFLIPNFDGLTVKGFFSILMDALGQLFYSLSIAMGIMVAYGSYVPEKANLGKSINQIEIFDTMIAILAGIMIIPAVYVFMGSEGLKASGPSLIFVSLPKIFAAMGPAGNVIGTLFFAMVLFAALTSGISILEAIVSSMIDKFKFSRGKAVLSESVIAMVIGAIVCLGYNIFYFELKLPNGSTGQVLDVLDYISNYVLMPVVSIATCILIGWVAKPDYVVSEVTHNGEKFGRRGLYVAMVKYIAPVLLLILFLMSVGVI